MTATHSKRCLLTSNCTEANGPKCNRICASYIGFHGLNGNGGRAGAANVPSKYRNATLASSPVREGQSQLYGLIDDYAQTFTRQFYDDEPRIKSMYLYSREPGTGKTTTAAALLNAYVITHYLGSLKRGRQPLERPAYFLDVNEWQTDYNTFNRPRVPEEVAEPAAVRYYSAQRIAMVTPYVVLDDIGVRDAREAFRADLHTVINARMSAELPTVYTSNIPLTEIAALFDGRVADRMRDQCISLTFSGESKRGL